MNWSFVIHMAGGLSYYLISPSQIFRGLVSWRVGCTVDGPAVNCTTVP